MLKFSGFSALLFIIGLLAGCGIAAQTALDAELGEADPARYDQPLTSGSVDFWSEVNPVLEKRCVVCHACYDAPCQLKLSAFEGLTRGASKSFVYHGSRLLADEPSRLFIDASSTAQWRQKDFFPVLNERENTREANLSGSVLAQQLLLKQENPLPEARILPDTFDFRLNRDQVCPAIEEYDDYRTEKPLWGMPYGLPGLQPAETELVLEWIAEGAPFQNRNRITPELQALVSEWESYFNGDSLKARLVNRYLYEHLFLANLYFKESAEPVFFNLVRSTTPPGQPIRIANTPLPISDPGIERVYYRLMPVRESISVKNNLPYRLDAERRNFWNELFYVPDYEVTALPSYELEQSSNPFLTFRELPSESRYRFLLDEAQFTIMGFIKGPVCRGQTALNVINDYFWVTFIDPTSPFADAAPILEHLEAMPLPASSGSTAFQVNWIEYARDERNYLTARQNYIEEELAGIQPVGMDLIWDGNGQNDNAALTIFRHFDSASVVKGLLGDTPQTTWVIDYPLLERIHYLLVAGFDVYGNVSHQLNSRIYMDFLRMEGESNFLLFLPAEASSQAWSTWYRGSVNPVSEFIAAHRQFNNDLSTTGLSAENPLSEMHQRLREHLAPVLSSHHGLENGFTGPRERDLLAQLASTRGVAASVLPQTLFIQIADPDSETAHYYTLLTNNAYTNISHLFNNEERRLPEEDTVSLAYDFIGAYPEILVRVTIAQLADFVTQVQALGTEEDYGRLLDDFGIRRSDPEFWQIADAMHEAFLTRNPVEGGLFDFNRLENR
ncbi:MAG: fatty acid cis/trans isomerase [Gammaproteobacteria bacterium]